MLLIYSDLAQILGIQEDHRIKNLANEFGMRAELIDETGMSINKKPNDPLKGLKKESKVQLFRITKS